VDTKEAIKALQSQKKLKQKELSETERKMKSLQGRVNQLSEDLSQGSGAKAAELAKDLGLSQKKLEELEAEYFSKLEELDQLEAQIKDLKNS